jgi:hypothetical protein
MHGGRHWAIWAILCVSGCGGSPAAPPELPEIDVKAGSQFNPKTASDVGGTVTWHGEIPTVPPYRLRFNQFPGSPGKPMIFHGNPNAPVIDPRSRGVANAIIYLKGIDPKRGRPWDLPPVSVEMWVKRFSIRQGEAVSQVGFVRRGDPVKMLSRDGFFHSLHFGGAAVFTLAFPDPDQPLSRRLREKGLVEATSGAGYYWLRAYLFVDDHPYYARTDAQGRFSLPKVPPGRYQLVCWLPDWREERHERDPESGQVTRLFFRPPAQVVKTITITDGAKVKMDFNVSEEYFAKRPAE